MVREIEEDGGDDQHAIHEGREGIGDEPPTFARRGRRRGNIVAPEEMAFTEVAEIGMGPLAEIRNFQQVGQHIIAVEAQQRIGVERHG